MHLKEGEDVLEPTFKIENSFFFKFIYLFIYLSRNLFKNLLVIYKFLSYDFNLAKYFKLYDNNIKALF